MILKRLQNTKEVKAKLKAIVPSTEYLFGGKVPALTSALKNSAELNKKKKFFKKFKGEGWYNQAQPWNNSYRGGASGGFTRGPKRGGARGARGGPRGRGHHLKALKDN